MPHNLIDIATYACPFGKSGVVCFVWKLQKVKTGGVGL